MRSHRDIVQAAGASALHRLLTARGVAVKGSTPQRWADRNSIPAEYWGLIADLKIATLKELAEAADARRDAPKRQKPHTGAQA